MSKAIQLRVLLQYALFLLAISIPTKFIISSICVVLLIVLWLLQADFRQTFINLKKRKALWPIILYYLLLGISYTYSTNKGQSLFDLQAKASYLILPLVVGAGMPNLDRKTLERFFLFFISGITIVAIIALIDAASVWQVDGYYYAFFYHHLVRKLDANAVYMAWYTIFSVSLLLFMPWKYHFIGKYKKYKVLLLIFHIIFFLLLSARMFIALFVLFFIPYFIKKSFKTWQRGVTVTVLTALVFAGLYVAIDRTNNPIRNRYYDIIYRNKDAAWLNDYSQTDVNKFDNMTLRLFLWRMGLKSVEEHNLWLRGGGNGDVHLLLTEQMVKHKVPEIDNPDVSKRPAFYNANLHNMFLQSLVMIGIPGLILFILVVISPFFFIHKVIPYQPFMIFHITSIFFFMQEAALQTQAGIFFYILLLCMFWNIYYNEKQLKEN